MLPELGDSRQQIGGHVLPRHIIRDQGLGFRVYGLGFKSSGDRTSHWSPSTLVTESRNLCRILPGLRSKREERTPGGAPKTWPWLFLGGFRDSAIHFRCCGNWLILNLHIAWQILRTSNNQHLICHPMSDQLFLGACVACQTTNHQVDSLVPKKLENLFVSKIAIPCYTKTPLFGHQFCPSPAPQSPSSPFLANQPWQLSPATTVRWAHRMWTRRWRGIAWPGSLGDLFRAGEKMRISCTESEPWGHIMVHSYEIWIDMNYWY